jgi:hypothetical protein
MNRDVVPPTLASPPETSETLVAVHHAQVAAPSRLTPYVSVKCQN